MNHLLYEIIYLDIEKEEMFRVHLLGNNFWDVVEQTDFYLDKIVGEENWEILKIERLPQYQILNLEEFIVENFEDDHFRWEGTDKCPVCAARHVELDRIMKFACSCGYELTLGDVGWTKIWCPECNNEILRGEVRMDKVTGKLIYEKKSGWQRRKVKLKQKKENTSENIVKAIDEIQILEQDYFTLEKITTVLYL